jgi:DNA-directed RNA polymerase specialized sigma24 family protein
MPDDPPSDDSGAAAMRARIAAHLAKPEVRARLLRIVAHKTPTNELEDTIAAVHLAILSATRLPADDDAIEAWMNAVAAEHGADAGRNARRARKRRAGVEDMDTVAASDRAELPDEEPAILEWLQGRVRGHATDSKTVAILLDKAARGLTYARAAQVHGLTEATLKKRAGRLVAKHFDAWQRHKRNRALLWLSLKWGAAIVVAVVAMVLVWWLLFRRPHVEPIGLQTDHGKGELDGRSFGIAVRSRRPSANALAHSRTRPRNAPISTPATLSGQASSFARPRANNRAAASGDLTTTSLWNAAAT